MGKVMFSLCPHLGGGGGVSPAGGGGKGQISPAGGGGSGQSSRGQGGGQVSPAGGGGQVSPAGGGVSILRPLAGGMPLAFTQEDFLVNIRHTGVHWAGGNTDVFRLAAAQPFMGGE